MFHLKNKDMEENNMSKQILLAYPRGFCAGVRRALDTVDKVLKISGAPVYVFHEIVHNDYIVKNLRSRGVFFVESLDAVPSGATLIFSAHGVSRQLETEAATRGIKVIDATCPLVKKIHRKAAEFQKKGMVIILIGHKGHPEIVGTFGQIERGNGFVVESTADVAALPELPEGRQVAYLSQTTLSMDETREIVDALKRRFPGIKGGGDICYATQNRQNAVKALCPGCGLIIIIGSKNSSNSNRLQELAERNGCRSILIDGAKDLEEVDFTGIRNIGISAGASAPECLVNEVMEFLKAHGWDKSTEARFAEEDVTFPLPDVKIR
jgi:4-hydroxy-3-methylbut-2-enyl diphosphate reductase